MSLLLARLLRPALCPRRLFSSTAGEQRIYDKLQRELGPTKLAVTDSSGGCGSMYVVEIEAECFRGLSRVKQTKLVNALLKEEIRDMHGMRRALQAFDGFQKVDSAYQARTSSGGVLSMLAALAILLMLASETREYLRYKHTHSFSVDSEVQQKVQINLGLTVAMPCAFLRVDVLDASGASENIHSSIVSRATTQRKAFAAVRGSRAVNRVSEMHAHDVIAEAARKHRKPVVAPVTGAQSAEDAACRIEGSVLVNKVAGLLHVTAHGHGHGGAHVPVHMLNFTHYIDELSFGPLYPSLVNPLDETMHFAHDSYAAIRYFISAVPTLYIDPAARTVSTNQYAVNEYYKAQSDDSAMGGKPPGIFVEYSFEPIAVTVREHRGSLLVFLVRLCAAVSGFFVTVGLVHRLVLGVVGSTLAPSTSAHVSLHN
ncbi:hypothetical protein H4R26_003159 [Coemansia thaxteri]|uniref:Uncharacterized protein n=1 Tax=Coemansia thaxteri TaxID=2663907 RepID=A0A9W8BJE0_9FUNG|nr:hypothetical protein H4R26_003159 [Coemansia thaxteri]